MVRPGEVLRDEFLTPLKLSEYRLAAGLHVMPRLVHEVVEGRRPISPDLAIRLARYFGTSDRYWLDLQQRWDQGHRA